MLNYTCWDPFSKSDPQVLGIRLWTCFEDTIDLHPSFFFLNHWGLRDSPSLWALLWSADALCSSCVFHAHTCNQPLLQGALFPSREECGLTLWVSALAEVPLVDGAATLPRHSASFQWRVWTWTQGLSTGWGALSGWSQVQIFSHHEFMLLPPI